MSGPGRTGPQPGSQGTTGLPVYVPVILSLALQLLLGLFLGHAYDQRIYMATGYLVGTGQNPYIPQDLQSVFQNSTFQGMTSVGYPPPWPLVTGLIYLLSYRIFPNLLIYNLALKLPIIAANFALAFLVKAILDRLGAAPGASRRAWLFMLFNPFILIVTTGWGQFDSIVALLALLALLLLAGGRITFPAALLALAISFKPTALPLLPAVFIFLLDRPVSRILRFFVLSFFFLALFCAGPFLIFHWDLSPILHHWNAQFSVGGGMSFMTSLELIAGSYQLPGLWWLVGMLWVPALAVSALLLKPGGNGLVDLLKKSTILTLVFFVFRTWLSEPNLVLVLPMLVLLVSLGKLDARLLAAFWVVPLIFSFFNTSLTQLLFPSLPALMEQLLKESLAFRIFRLVSRTAVVVLWLWLEGAIALTLWRQDQIRLDKWGGRLNKLKFRRADSA